MADFVRRKFSPTLLDRLVGPFVSGIYAGDPEKLSMRSAFPIVHEAESAGGSVIRGLMKVMKARKAEREKNGTPYERPTLQTFKGGNESLIRALAENLGERLHWRVEVVTIEALPPSPEPKAPRFRVLLRRPGGNDTVECERLIVATPTDSAGRMLAGVNPAFEEILCGISYAGIAVVSLGYRKSDVGNALNGFGFLVPRSTGLSVLGAVWNSSLFPGRAPEGHALMTSFVGGALHPEALGKTPDELVSLVHREISPLLEIREQPVFRNVTVWPRAIPQYNVGHGAKLAALNRARQGFPGLYFAGSYLNGPAIGTCVEHAFKLANEVRISFAN